MTIAISALILILVWVMLRGLVFVIGTFFQQGAQTHYEVTSGDFPPQIG